ncbi:MAG TPA: glutamate mutase L, partial [Candidatus Cloacimonadota bacterium]|nr:glutamate mutase L [Candidatus Cloacimonadota bacterium]
MDNSIKYYLITDVGSTTTKAVLISSGPEGTRLEGIAHSDTTVEAPVGDVCIGVRRAVQALEQKTGVDLLIGSADGLKFNQNVSFLSTSSAGGGLQVLVIGLTLFDSASSGTRAAYGAGGIILDTFAIDDKRKAV